MKLAGKCLLCVGFCLLSAFVTQNVALATGVVALYVRIHNVMVQSDGQVRVMFMATVGGGTGPGTLDSNPYMANCKREDDSMLQHKRFVGYLNTADRGYKAMMTILLSGYYGKHVMALTIQDVVTNKETRHCVITAVSTGNGWHGIIGTGSTDGTAQQITTPDVPTPKN